MLGLVGDSCCVLLGWILLPIDVSEVDWTQFSGLFCRLSLLWFVWIFFGIGLWDFGLILLLGNFGICFVYMLLLLLPLLCLVLFTSLL
jgi:hypothetical protein